MSKFEIEVPVNGKLVKVAKTGATSDGSLFDMFVFDNDGDTIMMSDDEHDDAWMWLDRYQLDELDLDDDDVKVAELV